MALALNSENDIFASDGKIKRIYDGGQVVQHVRTRLLHYYGEWFLDTNSGVPYFDQIFTRPADLLAAESIIKGVIIRTPGIDTLDTFELSFDRNTRVLSVSFSATTTDGDAVNATINEAV